MKAKHEMHFLRECKSHNEYPNLYLGKISKTNIKRKKETLTATKT